MNSTPLAVDIETVGKDWEEFNEETRKYLMNRGRKDKTEAEVIDRLSLNPGTGRIVAIGCGARRKARAESCSRKTPTTKFPRSGRVSPIRK